MKKCLMLLLVAFILVDLVQHSDAAGGKGKPRRKKKTTTMSPLQGGKGRREPCVGMCFYRKLNGIVLTEKEKDRRQNWKPCVGLCYLNKLRLSEGKKEIVFVNKALYGMY